jgi:hypothetical protein
LRNKTGEFLVLNNVLNKKMFGGKANQLISE